MIDYYEIDLLGLVPNEPSGAYVPLQRLEADMIKQGYKILHPAIGPNRRYGVKQFPHDFGPYYQVVAYYSDEDPESEEWALATEDILPEDAFRAAVRTLTDEQAADPNVAELIRRFEAEYGPL